MEPSAREAAIHCAFGAGIKQISRDKTKTSPEPPKARLMGGAADRRQ
jgi:hypothetical protein